MRNIGLISDTFFPCSSPPYTDYQPDLCLLSPKYILYLFTSPYLHYHHVSSEHRHPLPRQLPPLFPISSSPHSSMNLLKMY